MNRIRLWLSKLQVKEKIMPLIKRNMILSLGQLLTTIGDLERIKKSNYSERKKITNYNKNEGKCYNC